MVSTSVFRENDTTKDNILNYENTYGIKSRYLPWIVSL
jgi:hypothetical protein